MTVVVLLGGATVSLSACTGDSDPIASPSPSVSTVVTPSPSPSVSPSPTALTDEELLALIPENARGEDFLSASNFAKFFVGLYPEMMHDQDPELFSMLSDPDCVFCNNALGNLADLVASDGSMTGGDVTVEVGLASGGLEADGTTNASFDAETADTTFLDVAGSVTSTVPGRGGRLGVSLRYDVDHWVVLGVGSEDA
ncbi:hypothetical protein [Demequina lutea]|uniref:Uncharacterized protein n=1 Tax=Demequina lutea TaxID=431489 RepID=A0A7Y9ZEP2_9MICO|nr:hypothetical protein [Demequina lutea]NYI42595.1 hypothetical protein [Demequina lutea]